MVGKRLRSLVYEYLARHLIKAVTLDQIITISNREWFIRRRKLTPEEILFLREESTRFLESPLWEYMRKDLEWQAWERLRNAVAPDDIIWGKAMFYNLDLIRKYLERMKSL